MVSVAPVSTPVAAKLAAVAAPEAVSVPVDTSPTVVKFPALAVLLMVSVLPVIPVAELSRPTLAAPVMLSELPDRQRGPGDGAAQEMAPEASTPVVKRCQSPSTPCNSSQLVGFFTALIVLRNMVRLRQGKCEQLKELKLRMQQCLEKALVTLELTGATAS